MEAHWGLWPDLDPACECEGSARATPNTLATFNLFSSKISIQLPPNQSIWLKITHSQETFHEFKMGLAIHRIFPKNIQKPFFFWVNNIQKVRLFKKKIQKLRNYLELTLYYFEISILHEAVKIKQERGQVCNMFNTTKFKIAGSTTKNKPATTKTKYWEKNINLHSTKLPCNFCNFFSSSSLQINCITHVP